MELLLSEGARDIVSACNSVSAFMTLSESGLLASVPFSITEMTRPTVRALARDFSGKKIVFLATPATIASGIYARGCAEADLDGTFFAVSDLAGAIERGAPREDIRAIVAHAISEIPARHGHTLALVHTLSVRERLIHRRNCACRAFRRDVQSGGFGRRRGMYGV